MTKFSRRLILKTAILALIPSYFKSFAENIKSYILVLTSAPDDNYGKSHQFVITPPGTINIFNLDTKKINTINIDFFGHVVSSYKNQPHLAVTFEQFGSRGALINLKTFKILKTVRSDKTNTFMGHSYYIVSKNWLLTTEHNHLKNQGEIVIRDPQTLKVIKTISSGGSYPHDIHFSNQGERIIVANAGKPSNLSFIDPENNKILKKILIAEGKKGAFSHFEVSKDEWILVGPRKRGNPPIIISPHGTQHQLPEPKSKKKGVLSILFIKNTDFVAATFPEANFLQIWDYKRQVVVKSFPLKNPRGLIMDTFNENESTFLVTSADDSTLSKVTIKQNEILLSKYEFKYGGKGAHISKILI